MTMSDDRTIDIKLKRSDGYISETKGLSYQAGLAIATLVNRASEGLPVKVVWNDGEEEQTVEV